MHENPLIIANFLNAHHMPETVGEEYPEYTIHNNLKGRYFYSHFIVKETEANLAKVLIQYGHRPL